jgi:hypothetical protein
MLANLPFADGEKGCDSTPETLAIADRLVDSLEILTLGGSIIEGS